MKKDFESVYFNHLNLTHLEDVKKESIVKELEKNNKKEIEFFNFVKDKIEILQSSLEKNELFFSMNSKNNVVVNDFLKFNLLKKHLVVHITNNEYSFKKNLNNADIHIEVFKQKSNNTILKSTNYLVNENDIALHNSYKILDLLYKIHTEQSIIKVSEFLNEKVSYDELIKKLTEISGILLLYDLNIANDLNELKKQKNNNLCQEIKS